MKLERGKITATIKGPLIMAALARFNTLDGMLAFSAVEQMKRDKNDHCLDDILHAISTLPLRKVEYGDTGGYFYATSIPCINGSFPMSIFVYRDSHDYKIHKGNTYNATASIWGTEVAIKGVQQLKGFGGLGGPTGPYKPAVIPLDPIYADTLEWVFEGDLAAVEVLLSDILYVGKKPSLGFGEIKDLKLEKVDRKTPIRRPLPLEYYAKLDAPYFPVRMTPPYWFRTDKVWSGMGDI